MQCTENRSPEKLMCTDQEWEQLGDRSMQASFTALAMLPCALRRHLMIAPEMGEGFLVKTAEGRYCAVCSQVFAELPVHTCSGNCGRAADTFACVQQLRKLWKRIKVQAPENSKYHFSPCSTLPQKLYWSSLGVQLFILKFHKWEENITHIFCLFWMDFTSRILIQGNFTSRLSGFYFR